jgi:hypothetical protein
MGKEDVHLNRSSDGSLTSLSTQAEIISVVRMNPLSTTGWVGEYISSGDVGEDTINRGRWVTATTAIGFVSDGPGWESIYRWDGERVRLLAYLGWYFRKCRRKSGDLFVSHRRECKHTKQDRVIGDRSNLEWGKM